MFASQQRSNQREFVAKRLKNLRESIGFSAKELAGKVALLANEDGKSFKFTEHSIYSLEHERSELPAKVFPYLLAALQTDDVEFWSWKDMASSQIHDPRDIFKLAQLVVKSELALKRVKGICYPMRAAGEEFSREVLPEKYCERFRLQVVRILSKLDFVIEDIFPLRLQAFDKNWISLFGVLKESRFAIDRIQNELSRKSESTEDSRTFRIFLKSVFRQASHTLIDLAYRLESGHRQCSDALRSINPFPNDDRHQYSDDLTILPENHPFLLDLESIRDTLIELDELTESFRQMILQTSVSLHESTLISDLGELAFDICDASQRLTFQASFFVTRESSVVSKSIDVLKNASKEFEVLCGELAEMKLLVETMKVKDGGEWSGGDLKKLALSANHVNQRFSYFREVADDSIFAEYRRIADLESPGGKFPSVSVVK